MFNFKKLFFIFIALVNFFPTVGKSSEHQKENNEVNERTNINTNVLCCVPNASIMPLNLKTVREDLEKIREKYPDFFEEFMKEFIEKKN